MKERTVTIPKKDILFDVDAVTHIFARVKESTDIQLADASAVDTLEDFGLNVITRFADRRAAELRELLSRFLKDPTSAVNSTSVAISSETSYVYVFNVEARFQDELLSSLGSAMEDYIATGAAADWFTAVGNEQGAVYANKLVPKYNEIVSYLTKRKFPTRSYAD